MLSLRTIWSVPMHCFISKRKKSPGARKQFLQNFHKNQMYQHCLIHLNFTFSVSKYNSQQDCHLNDSFDFIKLERVQDTYFRDDGLDWWLSAGGEGRPLRQWLALEWRPRCARSGISASPDSGGEVRSHYHWVWTSFVSVAHEFHRRWKFWKEQPEITTVKNTRVLVDNLVSRFFQMMGGGGDFFLHVLVTGTVRQMATYRGKMNGWDLN